MSATFLPEIAEENEWEKEETLAHLISKAGVRGTTSYKDFPDLKLTRYTGEKSSMTYKEYLEYSKAHSSEIRNA